MKENTLIDFISYYSKHTALHNIVKTYPFLEDNKHLHSLRRVFTTASPS